MSENIYDLLIFLHKKTILELLILKVKYKLEEYYKKWTLNDSINSKKVKETVKTIDYINKYIKILYKKKKLLEHDIYIIKKNNNINYNILDNIFNNNNINIKDNIFNNNNINNIKKNNTEGAPLSIGCSASLDVKYLIGNLEIRKFKIY